MSNIIIKKLEDRVFDSSSEALYRLNELGRNNIDSEAYKDLADQVRSTCPCNCYFSTRKSYKVEVNYEGTYYVRNDTTHTNRPGFGTYSEFACSGSGTGLISKGEKSCELTLTSSSSIAKVDEGHDPSDFSESSVRNGACGGEFEGNSNFSIQLSDDCKHWIFSFSPSWIGGYDRAGTSDCVEESLNSVFNRVTKKENIDSETYPDVNSAYPSGTMTLIYKFVRDESYAEEEPNTYIHIKENHYVKIEATVTPLDNSSNNLNLINSLYSDLDENLTKEQ